MSAQPSFRLRHLHQVVPYAHVSTAESTPSHSAGSAGAMPSQSSAGHLTRCLAWAEACGKLHAACQFSARLDGRQVSLELFEQFHATPELGRSLSARVDPYHDSESCGDLTLIDAGGEAVVFFDPDHQRVIKLFAPPNDGGFGYVLDQGSNGRWRIRGGSLIEALNRFAWFEACFVSGLELDSLGTRADFLTLSQPFFVGRRPCEDELEEWMKACGWEPWSPNTESAVVAQQTWRRGEFVATDVAPRNAIITEADNKLRAIDFVVTRLSDEPQ